MKNNRRIYYNNQCVFITENAQELIKEQSLTNAWVLRKCKNKSLKHCFIQFVESGFPVLILEGNSTEISERFKNEFTTIKAGGGIVWNELDELLMIHRLGKWDLPKGKLDEGEGIEQCALREVEEETALQDIKIEGGEQSTFHIYQLKDEWILKHTFWYKMSAPKQELIPQTEEDIHEAIWVPKHQIPEKLKNSYPNIIYLMQK